LLPVIAQPQGNNKPLVGFEALYFACASAIISASFMHQKQHVPKKKPDCALL